MNEADRGETYGNLLQKGQSSTGFGPAKECQRGLPETKGITLNSAKTSAGISPAWSATKTFLFDQMPNGRSGSRPDSAGDGYECFSLLTLL